MKNINEIEYEKIFSPETLASLKGKSGESLRQMLGNKNLMAAIREMKGLIDEINIIEEGYEDELSAVAVDIVKKAYPIINYAGIEIDAKIVKTSACANGQCGIEKKKDDYEPEDLSSDMKRRIINAITQGSSVRGAFAFYMFKEAIDDLNPDLVDKYGSVLKNTFGMFDDDQAIAFMLAQLAQRQQSQTGGESKAEVDEDGKLKIVARAINFPYLVHEIVKGLYEILSLQGFSGDKEQNQKLIGRVDKVEHEPEDMRYGKFIYDAVNDLYIESNIDDSRVRELFFAELYKLPEIEFLEFIENAVNGKLTSQQKSWATGEMKSIEKDLKADDTGLDEILRKIDKKNFLK